MERSNILTQFLVRFDRELNRRRFECSVSRCEEICEGTDDYPQMRGIHMEMFIME